MPGTRRTAKSAAAADKIDLFKQHRDEYASPKKPTFVDCGEGDEKTRISVFVDPGREVPDGTVVTLRRNRADMGIGSEDPR